MKYIQTFDGNVKAKGVTTDTLFYSSIATDGLVIVDGVVTKYEGTAKEVYIPDYYNGVLVTVIDDSAFANNANIVSVRFPKRLERIAESAFYGCTGLTRIELGDADLDTAPEIASASFAGCTNLEIVKIKSVWLPSIGSGAFAIPTDQRCYLVRPVYAEDVQDWEAVAEREGLRIEVDYENKRCAEALMAVKDGNGDNIAESYAKTDGTYPNMTVGNATNASKATTTDFTNKAWQYVNGGSLTLTAGTWQIYYEGSQEGKTVNANFGLVYFNGTITTTAYTKATIGGGASKVEYYLTIGTNGNVTVYVDGEQGDIRNLYYREIK
jgi:hypothetical protein